MGKEQHSKGRMSSEQREFVNGRPFIVRIRTTEQDGRTYWIGNAEAEGKSYHAVNRVSETALSESHLREKLHAWMLKYRP